MRCKSTKTYVGGQMKFTVEMAPWELKVLIGNARKAENEAIMNNLLKVLEQAEAKVKANMYN